MKVQSGASFALFLWWLLTAPALAQQQLVVELPTDWEAGHEYRIQLVREREAYRGAARVSTLASRTVIDFQVLGRTEQGWLFRWTWGPVELLEAPALPELLTDTLAMLSEGLRLDMRTDEFGTPEALENLKEVADHYGGAVSSFIESLKEMGLPAEQFSQVEEAVSRLEPGLASAALSEPKLYYLASGGTFILGHRSEYPHLLANPFGGDPIPSTAWFTLASVDQAGSTATVEWGQRLDEEEARRFVLGLLTQAAERAGSPPPSEAEVPRLSIQDAAIFVMDTATGWPRSVEHQRTVVSGEQRRVERRRFTMLPLRGS